MSAFKKNSSFSVEAGLKYFILGSFSSALFLFGSSIIYGVLGTLNFEDLKILFNMLEPGSNVILFDMTNLDMEIDLQFSQGAVFDPNLLQFSLVFILTSLFFKLAVAPMHMWSPDVYENSPTSSTVFFAVVSKLSILILLIRIFQHSLHGFIYTWRYYVVSLAVFSVVVGSITALEQRKLKSLFAYSSVGHIGYILISFSSGTSEGMQNLYLYIFIYMLAGLCIWSIFLILRLKNIYTKKKNKDLTDFVLLFKSNPTIALCFSTVLLSIAGFPPLIGFLTKMGIFLTAIESTMFFSAIIAILASVIGTFYYIRIIKILYFEKVLVGNLFYPLDYIKTFVIVLTFYLFIYLFINPTFIYLICYKISVLSL
jgi:NADH-quinone oxidoreductase subunit N